MPQLYQTPVWRLKLPDAWSVDDGSTEILVTFYRPDGAGLLRVITGGNESPGQHPGEKFHGRVPGRTWTTASADGFTRTWLLACSGHRVWVIHSCAAIDAGRENPEVEQILHSLWHANRPDWAPWRRCHPAPNNVFRPRRLRRTTARQSSAAPTD